MDLQIKFDNGLMVVHLEEFLDCRSISKVRKLLKIIRNSYNPECEQQIKEFVQDWIEQFEPVQKEHTLYIEGYKQKVRFAEQQVRSSQMNVKRAELKVKQCQNNRDSHRKNTKIWKSCNEEVKRMRAELKPPKNELKEQRNELQNLKILLWSRQKEFDSNVRNKDFYKKVLENIT